MLLHSVFLAVQHFCVFKSISLQTIHELICLQDLGEYGIAPRHFATSEAFSSEEQSRKRRAEAMLLTRDSILPASAALADLIVPER